MTRAFSFRRNRAALRRLTRQLISNRRGVALVEFAMILPVMLMVYFGVVEVAQGVMINRKVIQLNRALADLTAQVPSVTSGDLSNIFDAAETVMLPFTRTTPHMSIVNVVIDKNGVARVCWSNSRNSAAPTRGDAIALPTDLRIAGTSLIVARASYDFQPLIGYVITGTITIGGSPIYMRPRLGQAGGTDKIEQVELVGTALCPGFG